MSDRIKIAVFMHKVTETEGKKIKLLLVSNNSLDFLKSHFKEGVVPFGDFIISCGNYVFSKTLNQLKNFYEPVDGTVMGETGFYRSKF